MPRKSKKFIDKKRAVTFQLVHRSQKDPLAADEDAPQRVLLPVTKTGNEVDYSYETLEERELRLSKQRIHGIGFDDDYDYMQHLKIPEQQQAVLVPKTGRDICNAEDLLADDIDEEQVDICPSSTSIQLPSIVFASKEEELTGMLHRAIPPVGPQVDWDPDVVAAMDEDFNFEDPDNELNDDFILQASKGEAKEEIGSEEDDIDSDISSDASYDDSQYDEFAKEETRSRFTDYSMTSSVLPRNDQLSLLDDQFEKLYETYDDDRIGDLGQVAIEGVIPVENVAQENALKLLLGITDRSDQSGSGHRRDISNIACNIENDTVAYDSPLDDENDEDRMEITKDESAENWDCDSILSTYSNLYNHPKLIEEPRKIKLSSKTGIPLDTLSKRGLSEKQVRILNQQNERDTDVQKRNHTLSESSNVTSAVPNIRKKDETKEEKLARKSAVREARRERRAEKKATKTAFREEKNRQNKELINLQANLNGIRIS